MRKEKDFENLQLALKKYKATHFFVRPFSLGNKTTHISESLKNRELNFKTKKGLTFLIDKKEILELSLKDYHKGFTIEYQNKNGMETWEKAYHPMDPGLPIPKKSVLRTILDDLLIEIEFEGKIKLKEEGYYGTHITQDYWKII